MSPGAKRSAIERRADGELRVRIAAPAVEGKANRALVALLALRLGVAPSHVRLLRGEGSRYKLVEIDGLSQTETERLLLADRI